MKGFRDDGGRPGSCLHPFRRQGNERFSTLFGIRHHIFRLILPAFAQDHDEYDHDDRHNHQCYKAEYDEKRLRALFPIDAARVTAARRIIVIGCSTGPVLLDLHGHLVDIRFTHEVEHGQFHRIFSLVLECEEGAGPVQFNCAPVVREVPGEIIEPYIVRGSRSIEVYSIPRFYGDVITRTGDGFYRIVQCNEHSDGVECPVPGLVGNVQGNGVATGNIEGVIEAGSREDDLGIVVGVVPLVFHYTDVVAAGAAIQVYGVSGFSQYVLAGHRLGVLPVPDGNDHGVVLPVPRSIRYVENHLEDACEVELEHWIHPRTQGLGTAVIQGPFIFIHAYVVGAPAPIE